MNVGERIRELFTDADGAYRRRRVGMLVAGLLLLVIAVGVATMPLSPDVEEPATGDGSVEVTETPTTDGPIENVDLGERYQTVEAALSEATAGDTIFVHGGTHSTSAHVSLDGVTIRGQDGATLVSSETGDRTANTTIRVTGDNVRIQNMTFDGGGVLVERAANVGVTENTFINENQKPLRVYDASGGVVGANTFDVAPREGNFGSPLMTVWYDDSTGVNIHDNEYDHGRKLLIDDSQRMVIDVDGYSDGDRIKLQQSSATITGINPIAVLGDRAVFNADGEATVTLDGEPVTQDGGKFIIAIGEETTVSIEPDG